MEDIDYSKIDSTLEQVGKNLKEMEMDIIDFITINEKFSNLDKSFKELDNSINKAKEGLNIE